MNDTILMCSGTLIYTPSSIKTGSAIQKLIRRRIYIYSKAAE
jgi:hypothetical protein